MSGPPFDLTQLRAGEEAAWHEAFRALWPVALHAALHPLAGLSREDAEEVASDALASVVPLVHKVVSEQDLKALLAAIAYRGAISRARRNSAVKRGAKITGSLEQPGPEPESLADCPNCTHTLTDDELARLTELLRLALASVDDQTRRLLLDNIMLEMTSQELGAKYELPTGTVSSKLSRGLKKIRASLLSAPSLWQQLREYLRY